jgi:hypothetical protein
VDCDCELVKRGRTYGNRRGDGDYSMMCSTRRAGSLRGLLPLVLLVMLPTPKGISQLGDQSAVGLIRYLTYQSGRPGKAQREALFECGMDIAAARQDRKAANSLVKLGASAVPDIEMALDSMEKRGPQSPFIFNGSWLLIAYARIMGTAAYPRLQGMIGNPRLREYEYFLDTAAAISLGLTSYVDGFGEGYGVGVTCWAKEPRDALDRLILAWERNDRASLEDSLGPRAKSALRSLLKDQTWRQLRSKLWHDWTGRGVAMGYRFDTPGPWAQPRETLDESLAAARTNLDTSRLTVDPKLDAVLSNKSGRDCGRQRVQFLTSEDSLFHFLPMYLVDSSDLGNLLRSISACATEGSRRP